MSQHQEKKYRVGDFESIGRQLRKAGARPTATVTSTHYYAQHNGKGVIKLVSNDGRNEIHILDERDGKFTLTQNIRVGSKEAGLHWLEKNGYDKVSIITMSHTDYPYKNGMVGLYVINEFLLSVILDYPEGEHEAIEREFGLSSSSVISVPYNKYLEAQGKLAPVILRI